MGDHDRGGASLLPERLEHLHNLQPRLSVQRRRGLVGEDDLGIETKARAIATRCFCPPERFSGR
jgi:hypothetical protein